MKFSKLNPPIKLKYNINYGLLAKWIVFLSLMLLISLAAGTFDGFNRVLKQANEDILMSKRLQQKQI
jgi:hypothetical protein